MTMRLYENKLKKIIEYIEKFAVIQSIELENNEIVISLPVTKGAQKEGKKAKIKVFDFKKPIKYTIRFAMTDEVER